MNLQNDNNVLDDLNTEKKSSNLKFKIPIIISIIGFIFTLFVIVITYIFRTPNVATFIGLPQWIHPGRFKVLCIAIGILLFLVGVIILIIMYIRYLRQIKNES